MESDKQKNQHKLWDRLLTATKGLEKGIEGSVWCQLKTDDLELIKIEKNNQEWLLEASLLKNGSAIVTTGAKEGTVGTLTNLGIMTALWESALQRIESIEKEILEKEIETSRDRENCESGKKESIYPIADWRKAVAKGETMESYFEWCKEAFEMPF